MVLAFVRARVFSSPPLKLGLLCFVGEKMEGREKGTFSPEFVFTLNLDL